MRDARPLTSGEVDLARSVFGTTVDYRPVRIAAAKWIFFQPRQTVMAPMGSIHFHPEGDLYRDDFAAASLGDQGLFIHEMTHVWQTQRHGRWWLPLMRHPFCRYRYAYDPARCFDRYGIEQQAELVRHAFLGRHGMAPPAAPPRAALDALLPFAPLS